MVPTPPDPSEAPGDPPVSSAVAECLTARAGDSSGAEAAPQCISRPSKWAIVCFLLIAFGLSWSIAIPLGLLLRQSGSEQAASLACLIGLAGFVGMWAPSVGAYVVRKHVERSGFEDAGLAGSAWQYVALAWFGPFVLSFMAVQLALLLYAFDPAAQHLNSFADQIEQTHPHSGGLDFGSALVIALTVGTGLHCIDTFGEEFDWRGYLLPRLMELWGSWPGLLAHGAIWGLWHAPVLVLLRPPYPQYPELAVPMFAVLCMLLGVLLGWLRLASGSILTTSIAHAAYNNSLLLALLLPSDVNPALAGTLSSPLGWGVLALAIAGLQCSGALPRTLRAWQEQPSHRADVWQQELAETIAGIQRPRRRRVWSALRRARAARERARVPASRISS